MAKGAAAIIIRHHIPKEKEGTYYTVPFSVPENVEQITVTYDYTDKSTSVLSDLHPKNTVDIGLEDEAGGFLGWSGSARDSICVGEYSSTEGYLCRKIKSGEWKIIVGAYHILSGGADVTYTIDFKFKQERLLFGDLHIHTTASDGLLSAYEAGVLAKKRGLDFIAAANHNNFSENLFLPHINGLTFIPAVEWTHYKGHMNFFGVAEPFGNSFIANDKEEMRSVIASARERGATVSVNHPKCRVCPYLWDDNDAFDMVEIWNGPMIPSNVEAVEWWTELLRGGRRLPAVGGSDFHRPHRPAKLGNPATGVYSPSASADDILGAIRSGRAFVCERAGSVSLDLRFGDVKMGGTARFSENTPLTVTCSERDVVLVTDHGEQPLRLSCGRTDVYIEKTKFAYVKVLKGVGRLKRMTAVSNPIYFE